MPTPTDGVWVLGMREFQNVNNADNDLYFEVFAQLYDLSSRPVGDLNIAGLAGDFSVSSKASSPPPMSVAVSADGTLVAAFGGGGDLIANPVVIFAVDRNGQDVFSTESSAFGDVMDVSILELNGEDAIRITTSVRDPVDSPDPLIEQVSAFSLRDGSVMLPPTYIDLDSPDRRIGTLGRDVITDYEDGVDSFLIRLVNPNNGEANIDNGGNGLQGFVDALNITDTAAGAQMDMGGHLMTVEGVAAADLTLDDFSFV